MTWAMMCCHKAQCDPLLSLPPCSGSWHWFFFFFNMIKTYCVWREWRRRLKIPLILEMSQFLGFWSIFTKCYLCNWKILASLPEIMHAPKKSKWNLYEKCLFFPLHFFLVKYLYWKMWFGTWFFSSWLENKSALSAQPSFSSSLVFFLLTFTELTFRC